MAASPMKGRPADLPGSERYAHGSRARYVAGCRCAECRAANTRAYHQRQAKALAAVGELAGPAALSGRCPGVDGKPCETSSKLRRDSKGGVCGGCRARLVWNGLVDAKPARAHLRRLSRRGVGYKSVADAADVGQTTVSEILSGAKRRIRCQAAKRILAVTAEAVADHAVVDGRATWKLLDELLARGVRKAEIARRLGMLTPALQIRRARVLARTAYAVARLHRVLSKPVTQTIAPPTVCGCARAVIFELDGKYFCGKCDQPARSDDASRAKESHK
jgi:hypothetical protein